MPDARPDPPSRRARAAIRGRDDELLFLRSVIAGSKDGHAGGVLIEGDAGIGKSRLVSEAAHLAAGYGFATFIGSADDLARDRPFSAVANALTSLRDVLPDVLWGGSSAEIGSDAHGVSEQVFDVLEARSLLGPVLLCLEDLHWADDATLVFVQTVFRRMEGLPLAVLVTFRPPHDSPSLAHVVDRLVRDGVPVVHVEPLEDRAVNDIAREALDADPGPGLRAELRRAAGSPLYVLELISALEEDGAITRSRGEAELETPTLPPTLRLTILRRIASMPETTLDLLRHASILGPAFDLDDLALVTGRSGADLLAAIDPARRSGFLIEQDDERLGFVHDLVRSAIYEDLPLPVRRTFHRQTADALASAGRPPDLIALHMSAGAVVGDRAAVASLRRAAENARRTSLHVADDLLQQAVELCAADDPTRDEILADRVSLMTLTLRPREAESLARQVLAGNPSVDVSRTVRTALAAALSAQSRIAEAEEVVMALVAEDGMPVEERALFQASLAFLAFQLGEKELTRERLAQAKSEAGALAGSDTQLPIVELYLASAEGYAEQALEHGLESVRRSASLTSTDFVRLMKTFSSDPILTVHLAGAAGLTQADRDQEAVQHLRRAQEITEMRQTNWLVQVQTGLALALYGIGELDDALVEAEAALAGAEAAKLGIFTAFGLAARIHLHRADLGRAREVILLGEKEMAESGPSLGADVFGWSSALLADAEGDAETALGTLELVWLATEPIRYLFGFWRMMWPDLMRLALAGGRDDLAREVLAAAEIGAQRAPGIASVRASAMRIRGLVEKDADTLADAVELFRASPRRVDLALTLEDAGRAIRSVDEGRALPLLTEALDLFEAIGATRDADRVGAALRELGVRRGRRGRRGRPLVGWEALTPSELRIAALVAEGLTNAMIGDRLFISRRTAQAHIRSIFSKLGMATRAELAAEAARRRT